MARTTTLEEHDPNKIIQSIRLPSGELYEIHDAKAIHSAEELGLSAAMVFQGTKETDAAVLAITEAKKGDVWLSTATNTEFVCVKDITAADSTAWEKLGNVHDAASSTHKHTVTVAGTNQSSTVTGQVTVPTISATQKHLAAEMGAPTVTPSNDSVLGADTTFTVAGGAATTTKIKATASGVAVSGSGTASAITGFGTHTKDTALGTDATFAVTGGTATTNKMETKTASKVSITNKSIPNVTGNTSVNVSYAKTKGSVSNGKAASWTASVTDGVLSFTWAPDVPTTVTLPTFTDGTATNTTLGTAISASAVTATDVTVATGALSSTGTGAAVVTGVSAVSVAVDNADAVSAITALGTPATAKVLTGVQVDSQPTVQISSGSTGDVSVVTGVSAVSVTADSNDRVSALTGVEVAPPAITLSEKDTAVTGSVPVVSGVTVGSADVSIKNGTAAAQKWTGSATVSAPTAG